MRREAQFSLRSPFFFFYLGESLGVDRVGRGLHCACVPVAPGWSRLILCNAARAGSAEEPFEVNLVLIAELADSRLLVGAPEEVWSKTPADRVLPKGALQKAVLVEVPAAHLDDPSEVVDDETLTLWIGILDKKLEKKLALEEAENPAASPFISFEVDGQQVTRIPYGPSLAAVCEDHFTFLSAASQAPQEEMESRMQRMEKMLEELKLSLGGSKAAPAPKPQKEAQKKEVNPDQVSLDSGNWTLGQEVLLENAPPLSAFQGRRLPDPSEQTTSHLLDDRWAEVIMWKVKDRDAFTEARKRLGRGAAEHSVRPPKEDAVDSGVKVPGASASTVHAFRTWNMMFTVLLRARTKLSLSFFAARTTAARDRAPKGEVWPMPLPFPELHRRSSNRSQKDAARKLAINMIVLVLNVIGGGTVSYSVCVPPLGTPLNFDQWAFIKRIRPMVDEWNEAVPVTPEVMGRSAAKVENVEHLLHSLEEQAFPIATGLRNYLGRSSSGLQAKWGSQDSPGEVIGQMKQSVEHVAKGLQPHRLKFWETPTFDPRPFLDENNRGTFERPLDYALSPEECTQQPPAVRVRMEKSQKIPFLELLDQTNRLALLRPEQVRLGFENGAFGIPKDTKRDRMVLDARPANLLESSEKRWIKSLGNVSQLNHFFLPKGKILRLFAEDLREYYHAFIIGEQRLCRNRCK
eukprot:Skav207211  [mRNA]  locus=scaffold1244:110105:113864:+ [translate_table: standard]